jgi:hypothetical protein
VREARWRLFWPARERNGRPESSLSSSVGAPATLAVQQWPRRFEGHACNSHSAHPWERAFRLTKQVQVWLICSTRFSGLSASGRTPADAAPLIRPKTEYRSGPLKSLRTGSRRGNSRRRRCSKWCRPGSNRADNNGGRSMKPLGNKEYRRTEANHSLQLCVLRRNKYRFAHFPRKARKTAARPRGTRCSRGYKG